MINFDIFVAFFCCVAIVRSEITWDLSPNGLTALNYGGRNWIGQGGTRETYIWLSDDSQPSPIGTYVFSSNEVRWEYGFGSINLEVSKNDAQNTVYLKLTVNNTLGTKSITNIRADLTTLSYPEDINEYNGNNVLMEHTIGGPAVVFTSWSTGTLSIRNEDVLKPMRTGSGYKNLVSKLYPNDHPSIRIVHGFPWGLDRPAKTLFPLMTQTDQNDMLPSSLPIINRPIAAGQGDSWTISLRWGAANASPITENQDIYDKYREAFPMLLNWPDRRCIGQFFIAEHTQTSELNPRGYFNNMNLNTSDGSAVQTALNNYLQGGLNVLSKLNCQGVIVWDVEGQEYPHAITYIGDPIKVEQSPINPYIDDFFKELRGAGYLVGMTVRPQFMNYTEGTQTDISDEVGVQLVIDKISYAKQRWGAKLFYMDSNGLPSSPISALLMRRVFLEHPDILLMAEHQSPLYYSFGAPFEDIRVNGRKTPDNVRAIYPNSFSAYATVDGMWSDKTNATFRDMIDAVSDGDILYAPAWYPNDEANMVVEVYDAAAKMYPPSGFDVPAAWPGDLAPYVPSASSPSLDNSPTSNSPSVQSPGSKSPSSSVKSDVQSMSRASFLMLIGLSILVTISLLDV